VLQAVRFATFVRPENIHPRRVKCPVCYSFDHDSAHDSAFYILDAVSTHHLVIPDK
jgi:hypothetical protein